MKAELESKELERRGVKLTSETLEEKSVLNNLWLHFGRVVAMGRKDNGTLTILIAPTEDEGDR